MRAKVKKRIPQIAALLVIGALAATAQAVVWPQKGSPKRHAVSRKPAHRAVVIAGGHRRIRPKPDVRLQVPSLPRAASAAPGAQTGPAPESSSAAPATLPDRTIDLCAKAGDVTPTGSVSVPISIWGFVLKGSAADCSDVNAQLPGPQLDVNEGESVVVNVTNALDRPISMEAPGIEFNSGPSEVEAGATVSLSFFANAPGTYLYESGGDAGRQEAMGLYGALVVHPATSGVEYGNAFDKEQVLVLSEIDPALNAAPEAFDMNAWKPKYWLINGKSYPDTASIDVNAGDRLLLRYANAGANNHTMTALGLREKVIARDDFALADPFDVVSATFPSGGTLDAIVNIPAGTGGQKFPLYNRNLNLRNGSFGDPGFGGQGGMMMFINVLVPAP